MPHDMTLICTVHTVWIRDMNEDAFEVPARNEYRYLVQDEAEEEVQYARRYYVSPFLQVSRRCMFLIGCGILALLTLAAYLAYVAQTPPRAYAQVHTDCGLLHGRWADGAYSFKGIPYAVPPVGEHRWHPPADLKANGRCWDGIYDATHFRGICAQVRPLREHGHVMGQEDCLHLNIWTPSLLPAAALPVMVWLHGGNLNMLSGQEKGYSPTEELARRTQTVFVSLNYRLNAFGFMALELLRKSSPTNTSGESFHLFNAAVGFDQYLSKLFKSTVFLRGIVTVVIERCFLIYSKCVFLVI